MSVEAGSAGACALRRRPVWRARARRDACRRRLGGQACVRCVARARGPVPAEYRNIRIVCVHRSARWPLAPRCARSVLLLAGWFSLFSCGRGAHARAAAQRRVDPGQDPFC
eukprot:2067589-Prymnesium_polylepis.2